MAAGSWAPNFSSSLLFLLVAKSMAVGTLGHSGCGLALTCRTTATLLDSSPWRQIDLIDSHCQQPPATSPASAARRTSAVPLYPTTSCTGSLSAFIKSFAVL